MMHTRTTGHRTRNVTICQSTVKPEVLPGGMGVGSEQQCLVEIQIRLICGKGFTTELCFHA